MSSNVKVDTFQHFVPSEEKVEKFLRGEGPLDFRSCFEIDTADAAYVKRSLDGETAPQDEEHSREFLAIRGIATTSNTDDNGVDVLPSALGSLPDDFRRRKTVLFNHDYNWPIGKMTDKTTKFIYNNPNSSYVVVDPVLIDVESRAPDGVRFVDKIERGILRTFSIGWSTKDGIVVFNREQEATPSKEDLRALGMDERDVEFAVNFGIDSAPRILVKSLVGIELSVVSAPADADAEFATASFSRNLEGALYKFSRSKRSSLLVPNTDGIINIVGQRNADLVEEEEELELLTDEDLTADDYIDEVLYPLDDEADEEREMEISVTLEEEPLNAFECVPSDSPWNAASAVERFSVLVPDFSPFAVGDRYPHHDIDPETLVITSNLNAINKALADLETDGNPEEREIAFQHLSRELTEIHKIDMADSGQDLNSEGGETEDEQA